MTLVLAHLLTIGASCGLDEHPEGNPRPSISDPPSGPAPEGGGGAPVSNPPPGTAGPGNPGPGNPPPRDAGAPAGPRPDARTATAELIIGGVPRPKEKVIVFLHLGHSNMAGRTDTPANMRPLYFETHPRLWSYKQAMWQLAKEPLSGDYLTRGRAGPGMAILRTALDQAAPDAIVVSIGHGQDGSRGGKCSSYRRGGLLYDIIMGPAKQLRGKVTFGGIFSVLVLMDVFGDKAQLPRAHECHEAVARDMRADLGDPNIPFLMSDWEMGATGRFDPKLPDAVVAREQLRIAQRNIPRSAIIPTEMLPMSDNHHFDLVGYKIWAERAFALIKQNAWAPWMTAADR
jgi:hypothetical protein